MGRSVFASESQRKAGHDFYRVDFVLKLKEEVFEIAARRLPSRVDVWMKL
ncbi:MAG: hypothetical protein JRN68_03455 [Nitrososphaerota archaeon]|nr:hypothetical protein [Ferrimicrobium acidiphilum]MDG6933733.1 hypothetical protein [Nitrososphaerota archaeon]